MPHNKSLLINPLSQFELLQSTLNRLFVMPLNKSLLINPLSQFELLQFILSNTLFPRQLIINPLSQFELHQSTLNRLFVMPLNKSLINHNK
jgi:hypothetical protein